jgi:HEAT repeat protein
MTAIGRAADEVKLEALFQKAARFDGSAYVVARDVLLRRGKAIVPLLEQRSRSQDWHQWSLAEALLLRLREPEKVARWRWALTYSRYGQSPLRRREDGALVATFDAAARQDAEKRGVRLGGSEVVLDREALPVILEVMRGSVELAAIRHVSEERFFDRALSALMQLAEPRTTEPLLHFSVLAWKREAEVVEALARIGQPALPVLHRAVRRTDQNWYDGRRTRVAAKAVGLIGDASSGPVLIEVLDRLTWSNLIPVYCEAIRRIGPKGGPDAVFAQLLAAGAGWPGRKLSSTSAGRNYGYGEIRREMLAFGQPAHDVLAKHQGETEPLRTRAIAAGMIYELDNADALEPLYRKLGQQLSEGQYSPGATDEQQVDFVALGKSRFWFETHVRSLYARLEDLVDVPGPVSIERAAVWPTHRWLGALGKLKGNELAFEVLESVLTDESNAPRTQPSAILAIAEVGGARAIDVIRKRLQIAPTLDIPSIVEALVLIGDPRGAVVLEDVIGREDTSHSFSRPSYKDDVALARAVLPALKGRPEKLAELLETEPPSLRLAVARWLAKRGDLRAIPVLFEAAVATPPAPTAFGYDGYVSGGPPESHAAATRAILGMGKPALAAIGDAASRSKAKHAALLAEALSLRIDDPELASTFERAGLLRHPGFMKRSGPHVGDYRAAGKTVAERVGRKAVPLLEAAVVWGADALRSGVAAFALAQFREDRSLEILVSHAGALGWVRGESLAAAALGDYGEKGIAAAKEVPAADPNKPRFSRRVGRHRAVTETLTLAGAEEGLDGILAGLKLAADGKIDASRTNIYLRLAGQYHDERLLSAAVAVVGRQGEEVADGALAVLASYPDPRIVPVCLSFLGENYLDPSRMHRVRDTALLGLARVKGDEVTGFLLRQLKTSGDDELRAAILRALGKLRPTSAGYSSLREAKLSEKVLEDQAPRIRAALVEHVGGPNAALQAVAAEALVEFSKGRKEAEAVAALTAWLRRNSWPSGSALGYVARSGDPAVPPALHAVYRDDPLKRAGLAHYLAQIKYLDALGDVAAALERRLAAEPTSRSLPEIAILARFGEPGLDALFRLTKKHGDHFFRVSALGTLVADGYRAAVEPAERLFQELSKNGLWDPRIEGRRYGRRSDSYELDLMWLAGALIRHDPARAYPLVVQACLREREPGVRRRLAGQVRDLEKRKPALEQIEVPLEPSRFPEGGVQDHQPQLPLVRACGVWLEAMEKCFTDGPPDDVRDRVIAAGEDSLQIAIELFYRWPTPNREQVAAALGDLTSEDDTRRQATALLAVRPYPAVYLDDALAAAGGETRRLGLAIRRWRQKHGKILDAADTELRRAMTKWMLRRWPVDQMRGFTVARLNRLATIEREAYNWGYKILYPLLGSVFYSPDPRHRERLADFAAEARPEAAKVAQHVIRYGASELTRDEDRSRSE